MLIFAISVLAFLYVIFKRGEIVAAWAKVKFQCGEVDKALKTFKKADKIGTLKPESLYFYGYLLLRTGNLSDARTVLTRASMNATKPAIKQRVKALLALVEWKEGNLTQAIETLEEVNAEFKSTMVYQDLGLLYILRGERVRALEYNLEAYDYNSDDLVITDNLAEAYVLCGKDDEAAELYEKLLEKKPHFPEAYYGYGQLLIKRGERERGLSLIRESLDKRFSFLSVKCKAEIEEILEELEKDK